MLTGEHLDLSVVHWCSRNPDITSDKWHSECLAQGDEHRVVRGEVVPQGPDPVSEREMGVAADGQVGEVDPGICSTIGAQLPHRDQAPQGMQELNIDQVGCG